MSAKDIVGKKFADFEFQYVDKDGNGKLSDLVGDKVRRHLSHT